MGQNALRANAELQCVRDEGSGRRITHVVECAHFYVRALNNARDYSRLAANA